MNKGKKENLVNSLFSIYWIQQKQRLISIYTNNLLKILLKKKTKFFLIDKRISDLTNIKLIKMKYSK